MSKPCFSISFCPISVSWSKTSPDNDRGVSWKKGSVIPILYLVDISEVWIDILVFRPFPKKFFSSKPIVKEVFSTES